MGCGGSKNPVTVEPVSSHSADDDYPPDPFISSSSSASTTAGGIIPSLLPPANSNPSGRPTPISPISIRNFLQGGNTRPTNEFISSSKDKVSGSTTYTGAGNNSSTPGFRFYAIQDKFESLEEVTDGLRASGLESSNLIVALDYTKSNTWTGKNTYGSKSLHWLDPENKELNPYMTAISSIGKALSIYDDDNLIPVFGFGDSTTTDKSVFPFFPDRPARGFEEVLARYKELTPRVILGGPTNFAPAIEAAIQIVKATKAYHILLIIADGQVTNRAHTEAAIVRASEYPLSIILVGVGDGPFDTMEDFDDALPQRRFDNFQFVNFTRITQAYPSNAEVAFAVAALMEVPEQYLAIRKLGYI